jgi:uncharacterized protein YjbJ (UPF0337 family)
MSSEETTEHADTTGRIKEAWGHTHDDEGIEVEGQLQQVDASTDKTSPDQVDDLEDTVRERSGEDVDPESTTAP